MSEAAKDSKLEAISANSGLVEELYAHGHITQAGRAYALNLLHPHEQCGLWASRFLLAIGAALVLCGIICFFVFYWDKFSQLAKLGGILLGIAGCLLGCYLNSPQKLIGQVLLLSASALVGLFLEVLGQLYQIEPDAYQFFLVWSILILGWTLISNVFAQWIFWLAIANTALFLWFSQYIVADNSLATIAQRLLYAAILNGLAFAISSFINVSKRSKKMKSNHG